MIGCIPPAYVQEFAQVKPLIGLTPTPEAMKQEHGTFRLHTLNEHYSSSVIGAGGIAVMLPSNNTDIDALLDRLDGVIITGGGDIDPVQFGEAQHEKTGGIDAERDAFEMAIAREAIRRDMPLLGICRGLQILNVALGGTIVQDIPTLLPESAPHAQQAQNIHHEVLFQTVSIAQGENPLRNMTKSDTLEVNSFHHQCIGDVADVLEVMASTDDGVVEAVYHPGVTFGMAVQWHPELVQHKHHEHASIFISFVEASGAYSVRKREVSELV